jgi:nucleotide-binding universal stress UspA family protein
MIRRVLHANDFSAASRPAFRLAVSMAKTAGASLTIAHVLTPVLPVVEGGYLPPREYERLETAMRRTAQRRLGTLVRAATRARVRCRAMLLEGVPADAIVHAARSTGAQVVVIGTHGRGGMRRLLLGSVAERVIATSGVPVLTVRGRS